MEYECKHILCSGLLMWQQKRTAIVLIFEVQIMEKKNKHGIRVPRSVNKANNKTRITRTQNGLMWYDSMWRIDKSYLSCTEAKSQNYKAIKNSLCTIFTLIVKNKSDIRYGIFLMVKIRMNWPLLLTVERCWGILYTSYWCKLPSTAYMH